MTAYFDRVKEQSTTTGTGNLTMTGAVTGFQAFASVFTVNADEFYYCIEGVDTNGVPNGDWEVGIGYLSGSETLVRDIVLASSNSGALVNLGAETKNVFVTWPGQNAQTAKIAFDLQYGLP